jgi:hypothetical protein
MHAGTGLWPFDRNPGREEIERLYRVAYYVDSSVFRREDLVDFGIDFHRLKECGEVRMKKPLLQLRRHVKGLWDRMGRDQRAMFLMGHFAHTLRRAQAVLGELRTLLGDVEDEKQALDLAMTRLCGRLPETLRKKLDQGLGKAWSINVGP